MRAFWAIVALLVIGAGWLVFAKPSSGDGSARPSPAPTPPPVAVHTPAALPGAASDADTKKAAEREATPPVTARVEPEPQPAATPAPTPAATATSESGATTPTALVPEKPAPTETAAAPEARTSEAALTETAAKDAEAKVEEAKAAETANSESKTAEAPASEAKPATEAKTAVEVAAVPEVATPAAAPGPTGGTPAPASTGEGAVPAVETGPIPAKFETLANGDTKVDGRFTVKGEGTLEKPYEVSWEHLISASELYNPRNGKKRLPERVMMLDGKYVRMTGYVAFPMYVDKPKELLSMLNQWDGCCIGVPPTPYDAIEVRLKDVVQGGDRYATQGQVTGKFSVKPYLAGDWLVGLYVMDDAVFTTKSTAGATKN